MTEEKKIEALEQVDYAAHNFYKSLKWESKVESALVNSALGIEEGALSTFAHSMTSKTNWIMMSLFFVAENGLNYHRY